LGIFQNFFFKKTFCFGVSSEKVRKRQNCSRPYNGTINRVNWLNDATEYTRLGKNSKSWSSIKLKQQCSTEGTEGTTLLPLINTGVKTIGDYTSEEEGAPSVPSGSEDESNEEYDEPSVVQGKLSMGLTVERSRSKTSRPFHFLTI